MACVQSTEQDHTLRHSVVLDGDGAEVPLMHSVSFHRRQKPQVGTSYTQFVKLVPQLRRIMIPWVESLYILLFISSVSDNRSAAVPAVQEVQVTPVRPVVRNREVAARYDYESSSSSQQQMGASTQERIKHLQKEVGERVARAGLIYNYWLVV